MFSPFFSLTSTISLFIALAQDILFYVAVILSLWHILFPFAGLANNYEALFSRKQTVFVSLRNQYMLSVFSFICNDTCCLFFVVVLALLYAFWPNRTSSINKTVEKSLLASTAAISLQLQYAIEIEMKCI